MGTGSGSSLYTQHPANDRSAASVGCMNYLLENTPESSGFKSQRPSHVT